MSRYSPGIPDDRRVERDDCGGQIRVPAGQLEGDVACHALSLAPMLWPAHAKRTGSAAVLARERPSGRWVPYVRMTRPLKRPMRAALTDHLTGVPSVRESCPAGVQLAVPSRRILLELRLRPRRCYLCRRVDWARRYTPRPDQASSLSLAMGLTTNLTTIWVCPPKYTQV